MPSMANVQQTSSRGKIKPDIYIYLKAVKASKQN